MSVGEGRDTRQADPAREQAHREQARESRPDDRDQAGNAESAAAQEQAARDSAAEHVRLREEAAALGQLGDDALAWFRDNLKLMGTEARLFLATLLLVIALAAMVGLLIAGAWVFLGAAAVLLLVREGGVSPPLATLMGAVVLVGTAACAYLWIRRLAREMGFVRSRQSWASLFGRQSDDGDDGDKGRQG